MLIIDITVFDY